MTGTIEVLEDPQALAQRVADWLTEKALKAAAPFRISLSGGSTPRALYFLLASGDFLDTFPWDRAHWYWGDERFVPQDSPDSNYDMVREALLSRAPIATKNVFPMPVDGSPEQAALAYERTLQAAYGARTLDPVRPLFDIALLGLGSDGHTASLLPGQPVLEERERWVAAVPNGRPEPRITLTYPALESSRSAAFLVAGKEKASVMAAIQAGDSRMPAARLRPQGELIWFLDRAAADGP